MVPNHKATTLRPLFWEFPNLVVLNLVLCNFFTRKHSFALFRRLALTLFCALLRVLLRPTAFLGKSLMAVIVLKKKGFSRGQFWGPQKHYFSRHFRVSKIALTKARLLKHDLPIHGRVFSPISGQPRPANPSPASGQGRNTKHGSSLPANKQLQTWGCRLIAPPLGRAACLELSGRQRSDCEEARNHTTCHDSTSLCDAEEA